jgi:hypothetical protein
MKRSKQSVLGRRYELLGRPVLSADRYRAKAANEMNRQKRQEWDEDENSVNGNRPLGFRPGQGLGDTLWKYEQLRAGQVYNRFMFNTRQEAEEFATQMTQAEPDLLSRIEPIAARAVWN